MGSLPNLRDLERDVEVYRPVCRKFPVHYRNFLRGYDPCTSNNKAIRHTRSMGNYTATTLLYTHNDKINHFFSADEANGYSPVSNRSTRSSCTLHHHVNNSFLLRRNSRQRDSMSSSGGASSVRRLIAVVRSTPSKSGPTYSRRLLFRNFAALCLSHAMITAAFIPLYTLQGSISVWWWQSENSILQNLMFPIYDVGAFLLTSLFAIGAVSTLGTIFLLNRLGTNWSLILSYAGSCIFLGVHLYPNVYTLIPAYFFMGIWLGPLVIARITCLMTLATKLTYVMTEQEEGEVDSTQGLRKMEVIVLKLFRGLQIAQDFGLIMGNTASSLLIWYTSNNSNSTTENEITLDSMFSLESSGERICGSASCPLIADYDTSLNVLNFYENYNSSNILPGGISCKTSTLLISVFLGFCLMGVAVTAAFLDHIRIHAPKETSCASAFSSSYRFMLDAFKDPRLKLAAPLSIFIGLEQGFMYSDFTKSYVACAIGLTYISLVFLSLGLLQSIAAFTLSLLVQHIKRHIIIGVFITIIIFELREAKDGSNLLTLQNPFTPEHFYQAVLGVMYAVGFIFQSCLILVLFLWKPSKEDPALLFVVPAAWGVCNAIWDTLSFSLLVGIYPDGWQAAFAHCYFFRYLGLSLAFALHGSLCNWLKLYGLAGAMILAIAPYTWLEVKHEAERKSKSQLTNL